MPIHTKSDGSVRLTTALGIGPEITAQTPTSAKLKAIELWPEYEPLIYAQQQVLFVPADTPHGYTFSTRPDHEKMAASRKMEKLINELCRKSGIKDS